MLGDLFNFAPMDVPDGDLKPVERAFLNGIRNLEVAIIRMGTMWITLLILLCGFWGIGGYMFYAKMDEISSASKTVAKMEIELDYLKEKLTDIKREQERGK